MKRCILHIGTEKTASTYIQGRLYKNFKNLSEEGVYLFTKIGVSNNRSFVAYFEEFDKAFCLWKQTHKIDSLEAKENFFEHFDDNFNEEIAHAESLGCHTAIITSEHFHSQIKTVEQIENIRDFLLKRFDKVDVVCYFRDPYDAALAGWSTVIKIGWWAELDHFLTKKCRLDNYYYDHMRIADNWAGVFGRENCLFNLYDPEIDTLENFCSITGVPLKALTWTYDGGKPKYKARFTKYVNPSLTLLQAEAYRVLNKKIPFMKGKSEPFERNKKNVGAREYIFNNPKYNFGTIKSSLEGDIRKMFKSQNEAFLAKYFPSVKDYPRKVSRTKDPSPQQVREAHEDFRLFMSHRVKDNDNSSSEFLNYLNEEERINGLWGQGVIDPVEQKNILCFDYGLCNFHNLVSFAKQGHNVWVRSSITNYFAQPIKYYESLGIRFMPETSYYRDSLIHCFIRDNNIDTIIHSIPSIDHLYEQYKHRVDFYGLTKKACELEMNKRWLHDSMKDIGVKTAPILDEPIAPFVQKPTTIVVGSLDYCSIFLTQEEANRYTFDNIDCFFEEYIPDCIETNTAYCMSQGKWSIMHNQQIIGEDVAKMAGKFTHWTKTSSFAELTEDQITLCEENAAKILDFFAGHCDESCYIGQITGLITPEGEWLYIENNVRPEQTNSLPYFVSGERFLEAMEEGKPEIIGDAFPKNVHKMIVVPKQANAKYPFDLHKKHEVAIPCGLDIINDAYRVSYAMRERSPDGIVGIVICDKIIPDEFVQEWQDNPDWIITTIYRPTIIGQEWAAVNSPVKVNYIDKTPWWVPDFETALQEPDNPN